MSQLLHSPLHKKVPKLCMISLPLRIIFIYYFIVAKMEPKESNDLCGVLNKFVIAPLIKKQLLQKPFFQLHNR